MKMNIGDGGGNKDSFLSVKMEYVRDHLHYSQVYAYYGLLWKSDSTHQISCPFHGVDKNPSARYYADTRKIFCFACNEGGDVVWFVKKREGHKFYGETLIFIAKEFGVGMDDVDLSKKIELEKKQEVQFQVGKRKIISDQYLLRVNDKVYAYKKLGQEVEEAIDKLLPNLFDRKMVIDSTPTPYMKYTQVLRHWANWCEDSLDMVVKSVLHKRGV